MLQHTDKGIRMATASQVKAGLDDIAEVIRTERQSCINCKARYTASDNALAALPTTYADVLATINGYSPVTTDAFELLAKAELAKLTTEFQSLKGKTATTKTGLAAIDFTI